jgi:hypothetical protein
MQTPPVNSCGNCRGSRTPGGSGHFTAVWRFCELAEGSRCCPATFPRLVRPTVVCANLNAFNKDGGGLRPIAVGETVRRVAAKCASHTATKLFTEILAHIQVGCGVKGGAEAAARNCVSSTTNVSPSE